MSHQHLWDASQDDEKVDPAYIASPTFQPLLSPSAKLGNALQRRVDQGWPFQAAAAAADRIPRAFAANQPPPFEVYDIGRDGTATRFSIINSVSKPVAVQPAFDRYNGFGLPNVTSNVSANYKRQQGNQNEQSLLPPGFTSAPPTIVPNPQPQPTYYLNPPAGAADREPKRTCTSNKPTRNNGIYAELVRERPPHNLHPPQNMDMGLIEICTFFPNYFRLPKVAMRALHSAWPRAAIAKAQLHPVNLLTKELQTNAGNRLQKQLSDGARDFYEWHDTWDIGKVRARYEDAWDRDATSEGWALRKNDSKPWVHMALKDIYDDVPLGNWPKGPDRLLLTRCFEFAAAHEDLDLDTTHYDWIVRINNWQHPNYDTQEDRDALARLNNAVANPQS